MFRKTRPERRTTVQLVQHHGHPPRKIGAVEVELSELSDGFLVIRYRVTPATTLKLPDQGSGRLDGLWRNTCFEFFVKHDGDAAYREFNFAPVGGWAAYSFTDWRADMAQLDLAAAPDLVDCRLDDRGETYPDRFELEVVLGPDAMPPYPAKISFTAVIEETDGAKSYWALRHPPGKPDFHHPDCFVLELPALG